MPRRRRKYRPQHQEPDKPAPFFARAPGEEPMAALLPAPAIAAHKYEAVAQARAGALELVRAVKNAIRRSQPDQALVQQSKALEWFNQTLEADRSDIALIQEALHRLCDTLAGSLFTCGPAVSRPFGDPRPVIDLGHSFKLLPPAQQVYALLKAAAGRTHLPERYQLPAGNYEHTDPAAAWADYLCSLLPLLPERPYLITGTPANASAGPDETGAEGDAGGDNERRPSFLNRLFGRSTPPPEAEALQPEPPEAPPEDRPDTSGRSGPLHRLRSLFRSRRR